MALLAVGLVDGFAGGFVDGFIGGFAAVLVLTAAAAEDAFELSQ